MFNESSRVAVATTTAPRCLIPAARCAPATTMRRQLRLVRVQLQRRSLLQSCRIFDVSADRKQRLTQALRQGTAVRLVSVVGHGSNFHYSKTKQLYRHASENQRTISRYRSAHSTPVAMTACSSRRRLGASRAWRNSVATFGIGTLSSETQQHSSLLSHLYTLSVLRVGIVVGRSDLSAARQRARLSCANPVGSQVVVCLCACVLWLLALCWVSQARSLCVRLQSSQGGKTKKWTVVGGFTLLTWLPKSDKVVAFFVSRERCWIAPIYLFPYCWLSEIDVLDEANNCAERGAPHSAFMYDEAKSEPELQIHNKQRSCVVWADSEFVNL